MKEKMTDLPPYWGFPATGNSSESGLAAGANSYGSQEEENMSINEVGAEPVDHEWAPHASSSNNSLETSGFSDIFRILSDVNLQDPASPHQCSPNQQSRDDSQIEKDKKGRMMEVGEPSNIIGRQRSLDVMELRKCLSEGNRQLYTEAKRKEEIVRPKRTRSAETHNMSERRRRGRIQERIRYLQQLVPKCNKKDCASILDEAAGYLRSLKHQTQMMSNIGMGTVYCNPYMPTPGIPYNNPYMPTPEIPNMPIPQYSTYVPFRPGLGLVPLVPTLPTAISPPGMLPLVQNSMEHFPSQPIPGNSVFQAAQPSHTTILPPQLGNTNNEKPIRLSELATPQEASTSVQVANKSSSGSIVHATHIVPSATEGQETD